MVGVLMSVGDGTVIKILVNAGFGTAQHCCCIGVVRSGWRWDRHPGLCGSTRHGDFDHGGVGGRCGRDCGGWR